MLSIIAERLPGDERQPGLAWEDLGKGAPTIIALAQLASQALAAGARATEGLSDEAKAILYAARERGVITVKASNKAFDSVDRFLTVFVEVDAETVLAFKSQQDPQIIVRFLDALRQLCASGLVMHQLFCEFSLSPAGFDLAKSLKPEQVEDQLLHGITLGRHEW